MAWGLSNAGKNASVNAQTALLNSGYIELYTGARPATPDTALSGNTLLATLTFGATAFAAAASGAATANGINSGTCVASGTATWARLYKSDGSSVVGDANVGTSGSDLNFASVTLTAGELVNPPTSLTLTQG